MRTMHWIAGFLFCGLLCGAPSRPGWGDIRPGAWVDEADEPDNRPSGTPSPAPAPSPSPALPPLKFDESGKIVDTEMKRVSGMQFDGFAAYIPKFPDVTLGLGLVLTRHQHWRPTLQVGAGVVGLGLAYRVLPVIELAVGVSVFYGVREDTFAPGVFVSMAHW